jgi:hypothetical protein
VSDKHWKELRAERAAARAALVESLDAIEARASDPLRLKQRMRKHPILFAGVAAAAGAIFVRIFMGGRDAAPAPAATDASRRSRAERPDLLETLRDAALRAAQPWVTRFVDEHLGPAQRADEAHVTNGAESAAP